MGVFNKLRDGLAKTRQKLGGELQNIFKSHPQIDEELYLMLEETLITADVGLDSTQAIMGSLREKISSATLGDDHTAELQKLLTKTIAEITSPSASMSSLNLGHKPAVILVVGVNGSGKTTSIAKLAHYLQDGGKKVVLAAADTFRAAAAEQLIMWGERLKIPVIHQQSGADPAAVAFDALQSASAHGCDALIVDTAGRLHNKVNLMQELAKISRVLKKQNPSAPHEVLLVLDATTGQNALQQAKVFQEISGVTGIILAKLDGTAKGGAVIPICRELNLPLRFVGVGEKKEDWEVFDPLVFAQALVGAD